MYLAEGTAGLSIIDVSNPGAPTLISHYDTAGSVRAVTVQADTAYVADGQKGLLLLDISNPYTPSLKGSIDTPGDATDVVVQNNMAYLADGPSGLEVYDVADSTQPTLITTYDTPGDAQSLAVAGNTVFVADGEAGLLAVNVPLNSVTTGSLTLTGTPIQGQIITLTQTLADADGLGDIRYQWLANGVGIAGASNLSLPLTQAEVGKTITVQASYTDGRGTAETVTSLAVGPVANVNDAPTGRVSIQGKTQVGQTLIASQTLADADGLGTISYQWLANGTSIAGATGTSFPLTQAEVGKTLAVRASYTDGFGFLETMTSPSTAAIAGKAPVLIKGTAKNDKFIGKAGDDAYDGLAGKDTITGLAGNDLLIGNTGDDSLDGGVGNDTLSGDAGDDILLGNVGADSLDGGIDDDTLIGGAGNDTLNGGLGADSMTGGDGDDEYYVDNFSDVVIELSGSLGGKDTVYSERDYTLPNFVENLYLSGLKDLKGTGNDGQNTLIGNAGNNLLSGMNGNDYIEGGAGDDTLLGGGGVDTLIGGDGSDTYQISSDEDVIMEVSNDGDQDVVQSKVDYVLDDNLEVLMLLDAAVTGRGNDLDNIIEGNDQANRLSGGGGDDNLNGKSGNDTLEGGAGNDTLNGGGGTDSVRYSGESDDYKISPDRDSQTYTVQDSNPDDGLDEGSDILIGIANLVFADTIISIGF